MFIKSVCLLICFIFPSKIAIVCLRLMGYKIGKNVHIGFSLVYVNSIRLGDNSKIGSFNLIINDSICLMEESYIGSFNILKGPFELILNKRAAIGMSNSINRSKLGVTYGKAQLILGELSKITSKHFVDLTRSVTFGDYTTLAGIGSQVWTHGYYHASIGPDRYRIDGEVNVGNNVYIGSSCLINPGVSIGDVITIGGNAAVSKSIKHSGMYVSQPLRYIEKSFEETREGMTRIDVPGLIDIVYEKKD